MREELQRTALLLDELSLQKIQSSKVAVFGIGGVGSYVVEALARAGIGSLYPCGPRPRFHFQH